MVENVLSIIDSVQEVIREEGPQPNIRIPDPFLVTLRTQGLIGKEDFDFYKGRRYPWPPSPNEGKIRLDPGTVMDLMSPNGSLIGTYPILGIGLRLWVADGQGRINNFPLDSIFSGSLIGGYLVSLRDIL